MAEPIWIYGAGGFGREVWHLLQALDLQFKVEGFVDDNSAISAIYQLPVLQKIGSNPKCVIAIADSIARKRIVHENTIVPANIISPEVDISQVSIGSGNIICRGNLFTVDIKIDDFVIINLACTIGHDVKICNFVSIMPGVHISGNVEIDEGALIGTGAVILPGVKIGAWSKIGAGAVVTKNVEPGAVIVGVPGRSIKK